MRGPKQIVRGAARRAGNLLFPPDAQQTDVLHAVKNEVVGQVQTVQHQLHGAEAVRQSLQDQAAMTGTRLELVLNELLATRDEVNFARNDILAVLGRLVSTVDGQGLHDARLADVDLATAGFLNHVGSHRGPLAESGLWVNDPVVLEWLEGDVRIGAVNERIVEQPFVYGSLASLPVGSRIVDIGGGESLVGLSLASSGHHVTVLEPAGYPYEHPNLTILHEILADFEPGGPVDAVVLLSAIEHFGIGAYAGNGELDEDADLAAMDLVHDMLAPGGVVVLTTPFGPFAVNELERTYDADRLGRLFRRFEIDTTVVASRKDRTTWAVTGTELVTPPGPGHVAMVRAHRPS